MSKKPQSNFKHEAPARAAQETVAVSAPAPVAAPIKSDPAQVSYICVLTIKENGGIYQAASEYKGTGLSDKARLEHLLARGAIKVA